MALVAARDQRALRILMERHMARAITLAERIVSGNAEADDIGQDAFLKVWSKAAEFDPRLGRFTTWLYRVVMNLALDRRRRRPSQRYRGIEDAAEIACSGPSALAVIEAKDEARLVEDALDALPERQKAAIALFHMEGLSGREAARVMSLSEKAFESLLVRARKALKQQVAETYKQQGGTP